MLRFAKVATPFTALTVAVPESVPRARFESIATVRAFVAVVTVAPVAVWMATCTAGAIAAPAVALLGWTVIASRVAAGGVGPSPHAATARTMAGAPHPRPPPGPPPPVWAPPPPFNSPTSPKPTGLGKGGGPRSPGGGARGPRPPHQP